MALFRRMNMNVRAPTLMPESIGINDSRIANFLKPDHYVSAKSLHNSDVYSAIYQISADLATSHLISDQPRNQALLDNPAGTSNKHGFWQAMYAQLLLAGNAYAYIWRNQNGLPLRLEYLRPSQVLVNELVDGSELIYDLTFDEPDIALMQNVPQSDMIHFRLMSKNGGMTGISPLSALGDELQIEDASHRLTLGALGKAIVPNGVLKFQHGGLLDWKMKVQQSNEFAKQVSSSNGPVVLDDLSDYTPLEVSTDVSKLLSQTDWTSKQIAKVFGIPDSYLNGQGDQQSSLTMIQGMYANALRRYSGSVESELDSKLSSNISVDINPSIDSNGSAIASVVGTLVNQHALSGEQATFMLKRSGFLPDDIPEFVAPAPIVDPPQNNDGEGGSNNDSTNSN